MREIGRGTRVFEAKPVHGSLRMLEGPEDVLDLLDRGAEGVIAVVRDAGATFLAPLYHDLAGVVCTAGTLRSHIGIVTRDFRLPCIMGAAFDEELVDGQAVELDCSAEPGVLRA
jgi:signal transduction protein with GAF and PtsI domain